MSKLQALDKEATVRFTVDMSETLHRKLSMLAAKTGRKKVDQSADAVGGWVKRRGVEVRILLILCDRLSSRCGELSERYASGTLGRSRDWL